MFKASKVRVMILLLVLQAPLSSFASSNSVISDFKQSLHQNKGNSVEICMTGAFLMSDYVIGKAYPNLLFTIESDLVQAYEKSDSNQKSKDRVIGLVDRYRSTIRDLQDFSGQRGNGFLIRDADACGAMTLALEKTIDDMTIETKKLLGQSN